MIEHDELCESVSVDIGVGDMQSPCGCLERGYERLTAELEKAQELINTMREAADANANSFDRVYKRAEQAEAENEQLKAQCAVFDQQVGQISLEASMFRVDPPMTEDELMEKFEAIAEIADNFLENLPASVEKLLAIKRAAEEESKKHFDNVNQAPCQCGLCKAIRAYKEKP